MIDTNRPATDTPADPADANSKTAHQLALLGEFTPVPRLCNRYDGWTPERQRGFIASLAETGSVRTAAHAVNMAPEGAYMLRRHPEAAEFRKAWETALALGVQRLEDVAMDRALHGVEVPVYHFGAVVGTRQVYNDRLLMFMLRNRARDRFKADGKSRGVDAVDAQKLKKLKTQWRQEWESEKTVEVSERQGEFGDDFVETLERRHLKWWRRLSPRARAAYREFRRLEHEDRDHAWQNADNGASVTAEYEEVFARDPRAPIDRLIESEAIGYDKLPEDEAARPQTQEHEQEQEKEDTPVEPPHYRTISPGRPWSFLHDYNDGRATPWP